MWIPPCGSLEVRWYVCVFADYTLVFALGIKNITFEQDESSVRECLMDAVKVLQQGPLVSTVSVQQLVGHVSIVSIV